MNPSDCSIVACLSLCLAPLVHLHTSAGPLLTWFAVPRDVRGHVVSLNASLCRREAQPQPANPPAATVPATRIQCYNLPP